MTDRTSDTAAEGTGNDGRVAVIGGGAAGSVAAWLLSKRYDVTLFEAGPALGGHAYSHPLQTDDGVIPVDMGVEHFNERLAPNLHRLLTGFGIGSYVAPSSIHVEFPGSDQTWNNMNAEGCLRAQLEDEFDRFHLDMNLVMADGPARHVGVSIGEHLDRNGYSAEFRHLAVNPIMSVYSGCHAPSLDYNLMYVAMSFGMHLLSFFTPGYWRKASGGIHGYLDRISADLGERVRCDTPVRALVPTGSGTRVLADGLDEAFDLIVVATHADQARRMLLDAGPEYRYRLDGFAYVPVESVLHSDERWLSPAGGEAYCQFRMPAGYDLERAPEQPGSLTRNCNVLRPYRQVKQLVLNTFDPQEPIDPAKVAARRRWKLPQLRPADVRRKRLLSELQGRGGIWFCGTDTSVTGHEGAVTSAMVVAARLGVPHPFADDHLAAGQFQLVADFMGV